jgi:uncharacterized membrane protein YphA (DoxX/SURF4 family)
MSGDQAMNVKLESKPDANDVDRSKSEQGWLIVRFFVAAVLLIAAGLKAHQLVTVPSLSAGLFHARSFNILVVEFELFFGIWLIFGLLPKLTWLVSIACFVTFALVVWFRFFTGEVSCGCFGRVEVPPLYTAMFDLAMIGMLIMFRPKVKWLCEGVDVKYYLVNYIMLVVPLGCFVLWQISFTDMDQLKEVGQVLNRGSVVQLEPREWIGKEFPLRRYCDVGEELVTGHWLVLLSRTGCADCQEAKSCVLELGKTKNCRVAILKMNDDGVGFGFNGSDFLSGSLSREITWFAETPIALELQNGIVKKVILRDELKQMY